MNGDTELFIATLVFGILALGVTAYAKSQSHGLGGNFVRLFGLLFIGTLATAIAFSDLETEARTGAYTILGTIAGYLAGSRTTPSGDNRDQGEGA